MNRRCSHAVKWFNCSVSFAKRFGEDWNIFQQKSSLCGIFGLKLQYLTLFYFIFVCDFNTTVNSQSFGVVSILCEIL